jgi:hypothetical protein
MFDTVLPSSLIRVFLATILAIQRIYQGNLERHRHPAGLLSGETIEKADEDALPEDTANAGLGRPAGALREFGYDEDDIGDLVDRAVQQRLLVGTTRDLGSQSATF